MWKLYLLHFLFVFFSPTVKCSLTVANISGGHRCAELKVANPARNATLAGSIVAQLPEPRSLTNSWKFFISVSCSLRERVRSNARFSSPLRHETPYGAVARLFSARRATNVQKSHKSLLYTCTLSDSQSGISRNFLQTSANHSRPLPSGPSVTEILPRRDEFQRRRWGGEVGRG